MGHLCHARVEPRLEDLFADPILAKLMRADRIEESDVRRAIAAARRRFGGEVEPLSYGE